MEVARRTGNSMAVTVGLLLMFLTTIIQANSVDSLARKKAAVLSLLQGFSPDDLDVGTAAQLEWLKENIHNENLDGVFKLKAKAFITSSKTVLQATKQTLIKNSSGPMPPSYPPAMKRLKHLTQVLSEFVEMGVLNMGTPCTYDAQCDDENSCTADSCSRGACVHSEIPACLSMNHECISDKQCDDEDLCTEDWCDLRSHTCHRADIPQCDCGRVGKFKCPGMTQCVRSCMECDSGHSIDVNRHECYEPGPITCARAGLVWCQESARCSMDCSRCGTMKMSPVNGVCTSSTPCGNEFLCEFKGSTCMPDCSMCSFHHNEDYDSGVCGKSEELPPMDIPDEVTEVETSCPSYYCSLTGKQVQECCAECKGFAVDNDQCCCVPAMDPFKYMINEGKNNAHFPFKKIAKFMETVYNEYSWVQRCSITMLLPDDRAFDRWDKGVWAAFMENPVLQKEWLTLHLLPGMYTKEQLEAKMIARTLNDYPFPQSLGFQKWGGQSMVMAPFYYDDEHSMRRFNMAKWGDRCDQMINGAIYHSIDLVLNPASCASQEPLSLPNRFKAADHDDAHAFDPPTPTPPPPSLSERKTDTKPSPISARLTNPFTWIPSSGSVTHDSYGAEGSYINSETPPIDGYEMSFTNDELAAKLNKVSCHKQEFCNIFDGCPKWEKCRVLDDIDHSCFEDPAEGCIRTCEWKPQQSLYFDGGENSEVYTLRSQMPPREVSVNMYLRLLDNWDDSMSIWSFSSFVENDWDLILNDADSDDTLATEAGSLGISFREADDSHAWKGLMAELPVWEANDIDDADLLDDPQFRGLNSKIVESQTPLGKLPKDEWMLVTFQRDDDLVWQVYIDGEKFGPAVKQQFEIAGYGCYMFGGHPSLRDCMHVKTATHAAMVVAQIWVFDDVLVPGEMRELTRGTCRDKNAFLYVSDEYRPTPDSTENVHIFTGGSNAITTPTPWIVDFSSPQNTCELEGDGWQCVCKGNNAGNGGCHGTAQFSTGNGVGSCTAVNDEEIWIMQGTGNVEGTYYNDLFDLQNGPADDDDPNPQGRCTFKMSTMEYMDRFNPKTKEFTRVYAHLPFYPQQVVSHGDWLYAISAEYFVYGLNTKAKDVQWVPLCENTFESGTGFCPRPKTAYAFAATTDSSGKIWVHGGVRDLYKYKNGEGRIDWDVDDNQGYNPRVVSSVWHFEPNHGEKTYMAQVRWVFRTPCSYFPYDDDLIYVLHDLGLKDGDFDILRRSSDVGDRDWQDMDEYVEDNSCSGTGSLVDRQVRLRIKGFKTMAEAIQAGTALRQGYNAKGFGLNPSSDDDDWAYDGSSGNGARYLVSVTSGAFEYQGGWTLVCGQDKRCDEFVLPEKHSDLVFSNVNKRAYHSIAFSDDDTKLWIYGGCEGGGNFNLKPRFYSYAEAGPASCPWKCEVEYPVPIYLELNSKCGVPLYWANLNGDLSDSTWECMDRNVSQRNDCPDNQKVLNLVVDLRDINRDDQRSEINCVDFIGGDGYSVHTSVWFHDTFSEIVGSKESWYNNDDNGKNTNRDFWSEDVAWTPDRGDWTGNTWQGLNTFFAWRDLQSCQSSSGEWYNSVNCQAVARWATIRSRFQGHIQEVVFWGKASPRNPNGYPQIGREFGYVDGRDITVPEWPFRSYTDTYCGGDHVHGNPSDGGPVSLNQCKIACTEDSNCISFWFDDGQCRISYTCNEFYSEFGEDWTLYIRQRGPGKAFKARHAANARFLPGNPPQWFRSMNGIWNAAPVNLFYENWDKREGFQPFNDQRGSAVQWGNMWVMFGGWGNAREADDGNLIPYMKVWDFREQRMRSDCDFSECDPCDPYSCEPKCPRNRPQLRMGHCGAVVQDKMYVIGGSKWWYTNVFNDIWEYDLRSLMPHDIYPKFNTKTNPCPGD
eukprot:TRINITY_DN60790_c0_g1_i1.p1 TRINITY_DN60790_c0_g1~~TRINITY_DN60790_c0_g1_i1.p1  ORF type:complete len:1888 (-),score=213.71 TRINITY_DN60790_c0_g1_i1:818-6457(-)